MKHLYYLASLFVLLILSGCGNNAPFLNEVEYDTIIDGLDDSVRISVEDLVSDG